MKYFTCVLAAGFVVAPEGFVVAAPVAEEQVLMGAAGGEGDEARCGAYTSVVF